MDRSAQNMMNQVMEDEMVLMEDDDQEMEDEIRNMRTKFVLDIAPLEIIDKEDDEDFIDAAAVVDDHSINQTDLVIHIIDHGCIYQYWGLKSEDDSGQLNSSPCHHQHHRDRHHLRDDDDEEEMIMINCQPACPPEITGKLLVDQGVFASYDHVDEHADEHDYIMSLLHDLDVLYESERLIGTYEHLQEMKRCIMQRISEAKPAVLMAKPKRVRIRVHLSTIEKRYYANSASANSAAAQDSIQLSFLDELCATDDNYPSQLRNPASPQLYETKPASRSSKEALETRIFEKGDLVSSSSSSCPVCLIEFQVGVDVIKKMPCSHVFHPTCMSHWLVQGNTCPLCRYELPTRQLPSSRWY